MLQHTISKLVPSILELPYTICYSLNKVVDSIVVSRFRNSKKQIGSGDKSENLNIEK